MRFRRLLCTLLIAILPAASASAQTTRPARQIQEHATARGAKGLPQGVKAFKNVEYANPGGKRLLLDLYVPQKATKPRPAVITITIIPKSRV